MQKVTQCYDTFKAVGVKSEKSRKRLFCHTELATFDQHRLFIMAPDIAIKVCNRVPQASAEKQHTEVYFYVKNEHYYSHHILLKNADAKSCCARLNVDLRVMTPTTDQMTTLTSW